MATEVLLSHLITTPKCDAIHHSIYRYYITFSRVCISMSHVGGASNSAPNLPSLGLIRADKAGRGG